jgi:glycosyltransferase involved in cell wall biosynthesis
LTALPKQRPSATVVIPALNEAANIGALLDEIWAIAADPALAVALHEVVVVDNGSTDATAAIAIEHRARVVCEHRRGYGRACLTGAETATSDILILMDGDRSEIPAELPILLAPYFAHGAALVIGSRIRGHLEAGALSAQQRWGNRIGSLLVRLIHGVRITDFGPYRVIRRDLLLGFDMREMTFGWPTEMIVRASKTPGGIVEVPVSCRRRGGGESKVSGNLRASVTTGYRMAAVMLRIWREDHRRSVHR